jgi:hypothetical protein
MIEVFCHILTFSIAIVGISAIIILLRALARGGSTPDKSNMISSWSRWLIVMSVFFIKAFIEEASSFLDDAVNDEGCSNI